MNLKATTIIGLIRDGKAALAGDGQVSLDDTIMKAKAVKIRPMFDGEVLAGFAGTAADALALFELLEKKLEEFSGNLPRAAVDLAKEWRTDRILRRLEAVIVVTNGEQIFLISGTGDIIEPDDDIVATGSGGVYALAAARALIRTSPKMSAEKIARTAMEVAADICIYTNHEITVVTLK